MYNADNSRLIQSVTEGLRDCAGELKRKKSGTIQFFVRDGVVQKRFEEKRIDIVCSGEVVPSTNKKIEGVTPAGINNLIRLITNALRSNASRIEYGDLFVDFSVQEDGESFDNVAARFVHHHHYSRR